MIVFALTVTAVFGQTATIRGHISDENGEPLPGASVAITGRSTSSDEKGNYRLTGVPYGPVVITVRFVGYTNVQKRLDLKKDEVVDFKLGRGATDLSEVVVVGYGTTTKKDLTGSISTVGSKDFNGGLVNSPEQLINGKVAGVQIMSNSGSATSGSTIRIRGGASLSASNDPLIIIDGVPLENGGISGNSSNFLSLINPNDIESMTVLKDASSTAIYGSRASNGVIIITTKKGGGKLQASFSSIASLQHSLGLSEVLSADQFRDLINQQGTDAQKALLGNVSTNWGDEVFKDAFGTDDNFNLSGSITPSIPFRASVGYFRQNGTLLTDKTDRTTGAITASPSLLKGSLKLNVNIKGSINNNHFANSDAVWSSMAFNPTQPIYSGIDTAFGGYYESIENGVPATGANRNPVGLLKQETHKSTVYRSIGNIDADYNVPVVRGLKAHLTLGYDYSKGEGSNFVPAEAADAYTVGGTVNQYSQRLQNRLFTGYLNYHRDLKNIKSTLDFTAGHDYQYWKATSPAYVSYNVAGAEQSASAANDQRHTLISFYSRLNYTYASRYLLTAAVRRDGTSRFNADNRWGTFPSVALAWRMTEENFLKGNRVISDLKPRISYGVTAQQEGIGNYAYLPVYVQGNQYAQYMFGDTWYNVLRPSVYVEDLKWETTEAFNYGVDFGFFQNRLSGSFDYYTRKTRDLLANVPVSAGINFDQNATTNVGNIESNGVEFALNAVVLAKDKLRWNVGFNATYQHTKVTNLTLVDNPSSPGTYAGPSVSGRGIQILSVNYEPYMFYVYKQIYDESDKPIEGLYADLNHDGVINESDLYRYHSPAPDWILGFNTQLSYKKWSAAATMRANLGNYVYNNMKMDMGAWETVQYVNTAINNLNPDYLHTGFKSRQYYSDYYVENGSFLKMDNLSVNYNAGPIRKGLNLTIGGLVQNVFTITNYSGKDPEVPNGFDSSFYPRARTFSLNVKIDF